MKKYEPAGGVIPRDWKTGHPPGDTNHTRLILAEIWMVTHDPRNSASVYMSARIHAMKYQYPEKVWVSLDTGQEVPGTWRRWANLWGATAYKSILQTDW